MRRPSPTPPVPVGIQRLLRLAAVDEAFRAQLLEKRDAVARAAGVELTETERAVLRAASEAQLDAMAKHLPPPASPRREFFRQTAATAAAVLAGSALLASESCRKERRSEAGHSAADRWYRARTRSARAQRNADDGWKWHPTSRGPLRRRATTRARSLYPIGPSTTTCTPKAEPRRTSRTTTTTTHHPGNLTRRSPKQKP